MDHVRKVVKDLDVRILIHNKSHFNFYSFIFFRALCNSLTSLRVNANAAKLKNFSLSSKMCLSSWSTSNQAVRQYATSVSDTCILFSMKKGKRYLLKVQNSAWISRINKKKHKKFNFLKIFLFIWIIFYFR